MFLAVILDAYSRRVIGWALDRTLEDELTLAALRMALPRRSIQPGPSFRSRLQQRLQGPPDRHQHVAQGESLGQCDLRVVMKTLKYEEVHRNEYRDLSEVRASIAAFLEKVYNQKRLHSALYCRRRSSRRWPKTNRRPLRGSFLYEFSEAGKSIHPMGAPPRRTTPPLIVWMRFLGGLRSRRARLRFTSREPVCAKVVLPVEHSSANGEQCLNCLSHARGPPQSRACGIGGKP